jgi:S-formylglutathione hydrolase FrmB
MLHPAYTAILKHFRVQHLSIIGILCMMLSTEILQAGRVDTLEIYSGLMQKNIRCLIITPDRYSISGDPYPVLYLLHGYSGNYAGWLGDAPQIQQHADLYNTLIVCPDGGYDSWYLDSPVDSMVRYESHITREVVGFVDYYYNTRREAAGRAIAGLSMGGHGALYIAIRHQDVFGAAGSMCGGLDLQPFRKNTWDLKGVLGDPDQHWNFWQEHSVVNLVPLLKDARLKFILDCGTGDFFLEVNREMNKRLLEIKYPHEYTERPGEHNKAYWGNAIDYQLVFFSKFFAKT